MATFRVYCRFPMLCLIYSTFGLKVAHWLMQKSLSLVDDRCEVLDINTEIRNGPCFINLWTGAREICANSCSSTALPTNRIDSTRH
jgi:hypothetical protein